MRTSHDIVFPAGEFQSRHEALCRIYNDEHSVENLQVVIFTNYVVPAEIYGYILGTNSTFERLSGFMDIHSSSPKLSGCVNGDSRVVVESEDFSFSFFGMQYWNEHSESEYIYVVSKLVFRSISFKSMGNYEDVKHRAIFSLAGPNQIWRWMPRYDIGKEKWPLEVREPRKISLPSVQPLELSVSSERAWHSNEISGTRQFKEVFTLEISCEMNRLAYDVFCKKAEELVGDLLLLVSFAARNWIDWFHLSIASQTNLVDKYRAPRRIASKTDDRFNYLVRPENIDQYIEIALSAYRRLRNDGKNIYMPIVDYMYGNEDQYFGKSFTDYYFSLEALRRIFKPSKLIKHRLKDCSGPERSILGLLEQLNVPWKDIYLDKKVESLINTRNALFHEPHNSNQGILLVQKQRLRILIERLLLRALSWDDLSTTLKESDKDWIEKNSARAIDTINWTCEDD